MSDDSEVRYKVAEAARLAGVSASTLRLWESQSLVVPERSPSGHRQYLASDIARLQRIAWYRAERGLNPAAIREALMSEDDGDTAAVPSTGETNTIGRKLRALRHARSLTLEQVASEVGVAASVLSTLERTSQGVSFAVLHTIAAFFDTTVSSLSGDDGLRDGSAVKAGEWRVWPQTTPGLTVQILAEGRNQMDCHRFVLAPGASSDGAYRHEGEEFIHVLSGRIEIILDGQEFHDLQPGDSLYFESRRHHAWSNRHDGETVLIWINTPPTF